MSMSTLDPMPTKLLKECLDCLLPSIVNIINISISSSNIPLSLKAATVTPLLKKTGLDADDFKNYRPVSNLPYLSKIIEKCIVAQLKLHMESNSLDENHQSAYRKNHSTETALLKITNDLLCAMDKSRCSILVMLDQSAAFDTVNQDILMQRFQSTYGITGSAHAWLDSYFRHRTQAVSINGKSSHPKELVTGFPQGSVLGPFSYPAYTSPLFEIARGFGIGMHMYADDTQIYEAFHPDQTISAIENLEQCITAIRNWMTQNHLKLNESKTEVLAIGNPAVLKTCNIKSVKVGTECVNLTDAARNIGAVLDSRLCMEDHVLSVTKSCYYQLYRIGQIRPYLSEKATAILVRSLILSKLDYVNSLLYGISEGLLDKLQRIQNNAARLVYRKKKFDHVTPLMKELHWLPVRQRIEFKINMITYKAKNNLAPGYISDMTEPYNRPKLNMTLRSSKQNRLDEKSSKHKRSGDRAYSVCGPKLWNLVPLKTRNLSSLELFKKELKTNLFKKAFKLSENQVKQL